MTELGTNNNKILSPLSFVIVIQQLTYKHQLCDACLLFSFDMLSLFIQCIRTKINAKDYCRAKILSCTRGIQFLIFTPHHLVDLLGIIILNKMINTKVNFSYCTSILGKQWSFGKFSISYLTGNYIMIALAVIISLAYYPHKPS